MLRQKEASEQERVEKQLAYSLEVEADEPYRVTLACFEQQKGTDTARDKQNMSNVKVKINC